MANLQHLEFLKEEDVEAWNTWRRGKPEINPDLENADLSCMELRGVNLSNANLIGVNLQASDLTNANLRNAILIAARLFEADLTNANLSGANLTAALFGDTQCRGTNFSGASLHGTSLAQSNFSNADFSNCEIYGVAVWDIDLEGANQTNLTITPPYFGMSTIIVDNMEVAQFIYLLVNNNKIRDVITSITSKAVLILGRFTPERKVILDALREELRKGNYLPILFDFDAPDNRDTTETVTLLARMARFIIADLTEPSSVPKELEAIIPTLAIPVLPLIEGEARPYSMFKDYWKYDWVLQVHRYNGLEELIRSLKEKVIQPAESKANELDMKRRDHIS